MSAPVAGRRKGLKVASSPSFGAVLPATQEASAPSWLADLDGSTTPPALSVVNHAPPRPLKSHSPTVAAPFPASAGTPTAQESLAAAAAVAEATEDDPLAFLNENEASPLATTPPPRDGQRKSVGVRTLAANDVGSNDNLVASSEPIALPPSTTSAPLPTFLREEGDRAHAAAPAISMTDAFSFEETARATAVDAVSSCRVEGEREQAQKVTFRRQLSELQRHLDDAAQRVDSLQKGHHPLAVEVAEVENTLASLRIREAASRPQRTEEEAERQQAASLHAVSSVWEGNVEEEAHKYRRQCVQHHQQQLDDIEQAVQAQQTRNSTLRAELEAAAAPDTKDDFQASVLESLLLRVRDGARHLRRHLAVQCSRTVSESARAYLAAARQQRAEVFANDMSVRERTLAAHRARREEDASAFHDMCRRTFQERADATFGTIKAAFEAAHRYHETECRQRVAAFQSRVASMTQQSGEMLEQQVRQRLEQESAIVVTQQDAVAKEWTTRQEDLMAQLRAFRLRAQRELCTLRDSHAMPRRPAEFPPQMPASITHAREVLLSDMDRMRVRMEQLALSLRIKQEQQSRSSYAQMATHALDHHSTGPVYASPHSPNPSSFAVEQISERWQHSLFSLQHSRETLWRSISDVKELSHGWAARLQQRRTQVTQQQEHLKAIRAEWEETIRGQLSRCLTATSSQVPAHVGLTTGSLENLNRRLSDILRSQQSLRSTRAAFTEELSTLLQSFGDYRVETERLLANVFAQLDLLRKGSVQAEVDQLTLHSLQAQVDVLEQHVTEEANRLAIRKRCLATTVKNLPAGTFLSHIPSSSIGPKLVPLRHEGHSTQATQIFDDANSSTTIRNGGSPAGVGALVSDADWQGEHVGHLVASRRAAAKNP